MMDNKLIGRVLIALLKEEGAVSFFLQKVDVNEGYLLLL